MNLARGTFDLRQRIEQGHEAEAQLVDVRTRLHQQGPHRAARGIEHRQHEVGGLEELVVAPEGDRLGIGQRLLKAAREFVHAHRKSTLSVSCAVDGGKPQSVQGAAMQAGRAWHTGRWPTIARRRRALAPAEG